MSEGDRDQRRLARLDEATRRYRPPAPYKLPWATTFSEDFVNRFCDEVANGRTLRCIAIEETWAPSSRTIYYWLEEYPEFARAYHAARQIYADDLAKQIIELADDARDDVNIESTRLQIHARQWLAAKRDPNGYGDRKVIDQRLTADVNTISRIDVSHLSNEEILIAERALRKAVTLPGEDDDDE